MNSTVLPRAKNTLPCKIEPLLNSLDEIQLKLDVAAGAAIALEMRLRIIAELEPEVSLRVLCNPTSSFSNSLTKKRHS